MRVPLSVLYEYEASTLRSPRPADVKASRRKSMVGRHLLASALIAVVARAQEAHGIEYTGAFVTPDRWYSLSLDKVGLTYASGLTLGAWALMSC